MLQRRDVPPAHFGEGITIWRSRLIELTWQSQVAFVYDSESFEPRGSFTYTGEGWGLTHDGTSLIMSDGTADLRFLDPTTFKERRRVSVTDAGRPVPRLNELEYVNGQVFANVWTTDRIARIDPQTGRVLGWIDLAGLLPREGSGERRRGPQRHRLRRQGRPLVRHRQALAVAVRNHDRAASVARLDAVRRICGRGSRIPVSGSSRLQSPDGSRQCISVTRLSDLRRRRLDVDDGVHDLRVARHQPILDHVRQVVRVGQPHVRQGARREGPGTRGRRIRACGCDGSRARP